MSKLIDILMKRDGLTAQEAQAQVNEVREMIEDAIAVGDYIEVENIMYDELGLEMDYIEDILF